jgi:serine/threonine-protein kinase RsbW
LKPESAESLTTLPPHDQSVDLVLPTELGYERIAMACSATLAKMHGCPEDRIEDLKTVVAEAAINAMQHGNRGRPESQVKVKIEVLQDIIHVTVMDEGEGLQAEVADPDIDRVIADNAPAVGFGLFLMRKLADFIEFDRMSDGGHMVRMAVRMQSRTEAQMAETHLSAGNRG